MAILRGSVSPSNSTITRAPILREAGRERGRGKEGERGGKRGGGVNEGWGMGLHRQRACGRERTIRWHRLVKRHGYTDHEY